MNYYDAREIIGTKKWKYTVMNDNVIQSVGYCAENCNGHDTAEEACEHYRQYLIDKCQIKGPKDEEWPKYKCAIDGCNDVAKFLLAYSSRYNFEVCEKHTTKDAVSVLIPKIGRSISSY